jgi:poly(A) polymerase
MKSFKNAKSIIQILKDNGHTAYFAGGWVRDYLLNHPSNDIDIATSAKPEEIQKLFSHTIPIGIKFGILLIIIEKESFEISTFRKDIGYVDGRRPTKIEFTDAQEDAKRRDFTINGMFYDPIEEKTLDFVNGKEDLKSKIIKAIGDADKRFAEDRLRMVRGVRLSCRFNFKIEEKTEKAILFHAKELFPAVAIERIWQEIVKMDSFSGLKRSLLSLFDFGLLETIFPSLTKIDRNVIEKRLAHIEKINFKTPTIGKVLELFPNHTLSQIEHLCQYLKLSKQETSFALFLTKAKQIFFLKKEESWQPYDWAIFCSNSYCEHSINIIYCHLNEPDKTRFIDKYKTIQKDLSASILRIKNKKTLVSSKHLLEEGIKPGKTMGLLIEEGERFAVNNNIPEIPLILSFLKKSSLWPKEN